LVPETIDVVPAHLVHDHDDDEARTPRDLR
jgi:hypothetical protein